MVIPAVVEWIVHNTSDAMLFVNPDGRVVLANAACGILFGREVADCTGVALASLITLRDGGQARGLRSDGTDFAAQVRLLEIESAAASGSLYVVREQFDDVSVESRIAECRAEVVRSRLEFERFAFIVAHDLKAPLRGVDQLATWIASDIGEAAGDDTRNHLRLIRSRVKRMEMLLADLLAYSRVTRVNEEVSEIDIRALVEGIFDELARRGGMTLEVADGMPVLRTLKTPLSLIFTHLVENALKHHDRTHGRIQVAAQTVADGFRFTVTDDGPGIPATYHEKVFELFQTLRPRDEMEATGVGLALVKKAVTAFGGQVTLQSGPGRGTAIAFTWPSEEKLRKYLNGRL